MYLDLLKMSYHSLLHRQLRSWLTILGIVIGIAAIIVLISVAQGLDASIRGLLNMYGTNYLVVMPATSVGGGGGGFQFSAPVIKGKLTQRDADAIKPIGGVEAAAGTIAVPLAQVEFKGETISKTIGGIDPDVYIKFVSKGFESGRMYQKGDTNGLIIGYTVAHDYFNKRIDVGNTILINGKEFKVRGVMAKTGVGDSDTDIVFDTKAAKELLGPGAPKDQFIAIMVTVKDGADIKQISAEINRRLLDLHKVTEDKKDFSILTADSILESVGQITSLLSVFLGGIAAISLVVGGIGIANTMFTSVVERTREIGTLKAIGARNRDILNLFIIESAFIGLVGGVMGLLIGTTISYLATFFGVPTLITADLVVFSVFFSVIVGAVSGFIPARQASRLQPVEALRYE